MEGIQNIAERLRTALLAHYELDFASPQRVTIVTHVFGLAGSFLMPKLDELARSVRHKAKAGPPQSPS